MSDQHQWRPQQPAGHVAPATWSTPVSPAGPVGPAGPAGAPGRPAGPVGPVGHSAPSGGNAVRYILGGFAGAVAMVLVGVLLVLTGAISLGGGSGEPDGRSVTLPSAVDGLTDADTLLDSGTALADSADPDTLRQGVARANALAADSVAQGYPGVGHAVQIYSDRTASLIAQVKVVRTRMDPLLNTPALDIRHPERVDMYRLVTQGDVACRQLDTGVLSDKPAGDPKNLTVVNCRRVGDGLSVDIVCGGEATAGPDGLTRMVRFTNAVWDAVGQ